MDGNFSSGSIEGGCQRFAGESLSANRYPRDHVEPNQSINL